MAKLLELRVVSPEKIVYQGTATSLVAPAWDGRVGVLPGHAPFLTLLGAGPLVVHLEKGSSAEFHVSGGVMKVEANEVMVLADRVSDE